MITANVYVLCDCCGKYLFLHEADGGLGRLPTVGRKDSQRRGWQYRRFTIDGIVRLLDLCPCCLTLAEAEIVEGWKKRV